MSSFVIYTAVLPAYRQECMRLLVRRLGDKLTLIAGERHLEPSVHTDLADIPHQRATNHALLKRRLLLQRGHFGIAVRATALVVDLNPRSLTAWALLLTRRLLRRRTLVWGHLHPQKGAGSSTALLRRTMRRLAQGTLLYGYASVKPAYAEVPQPLWVAANALYRAAEIRPATDSGHDRNAFVYVGRLEPDKKPRLLIDAFNISNLAEQGARLVLVGSGSMRGELENYAQGLPWADAIEFRGRISSPSALRELYADVVASISPSFAGLSLTQSLGFGIPMLVADNEPHSPEIELERFGGVTYFEAGSAESLADEMRRAFANVDDAKAAELSADVRRLYSAEAMASGIEAALHGDAPVGSEAALGGEVAGAGGGTWRA